MVQKAQLSTNYLDIIKKLQDDVRNLYSLYRTQHTPGQSIQSIGQGGGTSKGDPGGAPCGSDFLPLSGGTLTGPLAIHPKLVSLTSSKRIDISKTGSNHTSYLIISNPSGFNLEAFDGATHAGQILVIQGVQTETTSIINSSDNIETINGLAFSLQDDDNLVFIFDITDNRWQQVTTGKQGLSGGAGANTALSNLVATSINQSLVPDVDGTRDIGSTSFYWNSIIARRIRFKGDLNPSVNVDNLGSNATLFWFNANSGKTFVWSIFGTDKMTLGSSILQVENGILAIQMVSTHTWSVAIGPGSLTEYRSGSGGHKFFNGKITAEVGIECKNQLDMDANSIIDTGTIYPFVTGVFSLGRSSERFLNGYIDKVILGSSGVKYMQDLGTSFFFSAPNTHDYTFFFDGFGSGMLLTKDDMTLNTNLKIIGGHFGEMSVVAVAPGSPPASRGRYYFELSGGKVRFVLKWPSGATTVVATEP